MARIHTVSEHVLVQCTEHSLTNSGSGSSVDTLGFHSAAFVCVATTTGTGSTLALVLQGSDDDSSWTSLGDIGTVPASQSAYVLVSDVNLKGNPDYRYYRVVRTVAGTVDGTLVWLLGSPDKMPVSQDNDGASF